MISLVSLLLLACVCAQHFEPRRIEASGRDPVLVTTCDLSGDGVVDSAVADFLVRARGVRPFCFCFLFHVPSLSLGQHHYRAGQSWREHDIVSLPDADRWSQRTFWHCVRRFEQ